MFKNLIKIAFRNIRINKVFSLINITGLSIGIAVTIVIGLMIYFDFSFDRFHPNSDRIYRITSQFTTPDSKFYNSGVSVPLADALKENAVGIETISPFYIINPFRIENKGTSHVFKDPGRVVCTDGKYFEIFNYQWLAGDAQTSFSSPYQLVLTEGRAKKYFPNLNPQEILGKILVYDDSLNLSISGIVKNLENRTDLIFKEFISYSTLGKEGLTNKLGDIGWMSTSSNSQLFIRISEKTNENEVQKQLDNIAAENTDKELLLKN